MTANFDKAFTDIVGVEGNYSNSQLDPGGETKFGISKRAYPKADIRNLTLDGAKLIYARDYWTPCHCDELQWPLCLFVFDAAVNQGQREAVMMLQKTLGVAQDGSLGPRTLQRIATEDHAELAALLMADRAIRYTGTRNFDLDGRGWFKRLFRIAMDA